MQPESQPSAAGGGNHVADDSFEAEAARIPTAIEVDPSSPTQGTGGTAGGPGAPAADPADPGGWAELAVRMYVTFPFNYLAARFGEFWSLSEAEVDALAPVTTALLNKWLPVGKWGEEVALAIILCGIVMPRMVMTKGRPKPANANPAQSTQTEESRESAPLSASEAPANPASWPSEYPPAAA